MALKIGLLELKKVAKKFASSRDESTEIQFIQILNEILTNQKTMNAIQNDIDCLCDITKLLCIFCTKFRLLDELLTAWLRFLEHVPSQTKYTIFLVLDIDEFQKCVKLFFSRESTESTEWKVLKILCSYLGNDKQKIGCWLKQLFHRVIPENFVECLSLYLDKEINSIDNNRINTHSTNECETFVDLTLDNDESAPTPDTAASLKPNAKTNRLLNCKSSTIQKEESREAKVPLHIQTKVSVEQNSNQKVPIAQKRTKIQSNDYAINVKGVEPDVYDFDEDDNGPVLKKKRHFVQPKKRKKAAPWPRINVVQNEQVKRPSKVYTIRAKVPVGTQAKELTERKLADQDEKSAIEVVDADDDVIDFVESESDLSVCASVSTVNEAKSAIDAPDIARNVSKNSAKVTKKKIKISKVPPSTAKPVQLPAQIIANIEKINDMVKNDNNKCLNASKHHRKTQSGEIGGADSSDQLQLKQKPQSRKLYTEIKPEFDETDEGQTDAVKSQTSAENKTNQNSSRGNSTAKPDSTDNSISNTDGMEIENNNASGVYAGDCFKCQSCTTWIQLHGNTNAKQGHNNNNNNNNNNKSLCNGFHLANTVMVGRSVIKYGI